MKHNNISIFIPHAGCKNQCSFCNQRTISSTQKAPTIEEVQNLLEQAMMQIPDKSTTEIAFFGGSFTAIDEKYMVDLLETANKFIGENMFQGIRISTRPDAITPRILMLLKSYNVTSIELGAQSMQDDVLLLNDRGHTADDVRNASNLIREHGFSLGLQMMVGLYGDSISAAYKTADEIVKLKPNTVRIYPTVILKGTKLAKLFQDGKYKIMPLEDAVSLCADLLSLFTENGINVIKLGLHSSTDVEKDMVGGIYHPAFRELCEGEIFYKKAISILEKMPIGNYIIEVSTKCISKMIGQRKINIDKLSSIGYNVQVIPNENFNETDINIRKKC